MVLNRTLSIVGMSLAVGLMSSTGYAETPVRQVAVECKFLETKTDPLELGLNFEVGSGAERTNRAKSQAKGRAMGSLLGGSTGSTFGSGSRSRSSLFGSGNSQPTGPETGKDPTSGDFTNASSGGVDYGIRANLGPGNKLTVSLDLKNVPGDGTFHSQWVRDSNGNYYLPVKYIIITLYRDWNLTVSWTYDRYVDGQHVEHREGGWTESGRDNLGSIRLNFSGKKGRENAIWKNMGFDTATKGVKHLVTEYDLPSEVANGPCPVRMTNHISLPDKDPVTTAPLLGDIPMLGTLFRSEDERKNKRNLMVLVTPQIIEDPEN